jgi:hypothetical protein
MEAPSIAQSPVGTGYLSKQFKDANITGKPSGTHASSSDRTKQDRVTLSREGQERASRAGLSQPTRGTEAAQEDTALQLDQQQIQELQKLKQRDAEVRAHEQAHLSAAGPYARGGASFTYERGPDGNSYAIGGEVGIDVGKEATPEATLVKMQTIKRAALAPASPSAADRRIASQASINEAQARQELLVKTQEALSQAGSAGKPEDEESQRSPRTASEDQSEPSYPAATFKNAIAAYNRVAAS